MKKAITPDTSDKPDLSSTYLLYPAATSLDLDMSWSDVLSRNSHQVGRRPQTFFILSKSTNSCKQASLNWMFCCENKAFIVCWYLSSWSEVQPPKNQSVSDLKTVVITTNTLESQILASVNNPNCNLPRPTVWSITIIDGTTLQFDYNWFHMLSKIHISEYGLWWIIDWLTKARRLSLS